MPFTYPKYILAPIWHQGLSRYRQKCDEDISRLIQSCLGNSIKSMSRRNSRVTWLVLFWRKNLPSWGITIACMCFKAWRKRDFEICSWSPSPLCLIKTSVLSLKTEEILLFYLVSTVDQFSSHQKREANWERYQATDNTFMQWFLSLWKHIFSMIYLYL